MATQKEISAILLPILAKYSKYRFKRGWMFELPIGYYLRGIAFSGSWSSRESFQIKRCVFPLFESTQDFHLSWGQGYAIPGKTRGFEEILLPLM